MAHTVTIRGSIMPCADLRTGEVRSGVAVTDTVRRRVARGYYDLINGSTLDAPAVEPVPAVEGPVPPAGNATTDEWLAFLQGQGVEVPVDDDGETPGREALKAIWRDHVGEG